MIYKELSNTHLVTVRELADQSGTDLSQLYRMIRKDRVPGVEPLGNGYVVTDLAKALEFLSAPRVAGNPNWKKKESK